MNYEVVEGSMDDVGLESGEVKLDGDTHYVDRNGFVDEDTVDYEIIDLAEEPVAGVFVDYVDVSHQVGPEEAVERVVEQHLDSGQTEELLDEEYGVEALEV